MRTTLRKVSVKPNERQRLEDAKNARNGGHKNVLHWLRTGAKPGSCKRYKTCSAPKYFDGVDRPIPVQPKGKSCSHTFGGLLSALKRLGYDKTEALEMCLNQDNQGAAWFWCLFSEDDEKAIELFDRWWDNSEDQAPYVPKRKPRRKPWKGPKNKNFVYHWSLMYRILLWLDNNCGASVRAAKDALKDVCSRGPRIVQCYLEEARRLGWVRTEDGARNAKLLFVAAMPVLPQPKPEKGKFHLTHSEVLAWFGTYDYWRAPEWVRDEMSWLRQWKKLDENTRKAKHARYCHGVISRTRRLKDELRWLDGQYSEWIEYEHSARVHGDAEDYALASETVHRLRQDIIATRHAMSDVPEIVRDFMIKERIVL